VEVLRENSKSICTESQTFILISHTMPRSVIEELPWNTATICKWLCPYHICSTLPQCYDPYAMHFLPSFHIHPLLKLDSI